MNIRQDLIILYTKKQAPFAQRDCEIDACKGKSGIRSKQRRERNCPEEAVAFVFAIGFQPLLRLYNQEI